jgi:hypothetical protein
MNTKWFAGAIVVGGILARTQGGFAEEPEPAEWGLFPNGLIVRKDIQNELNLSAEQLAKLTLLTNEFDAAVLELFPDAGVPSPGLQPPSEGERIKRIRAANAKRAEQLKHILPKFSSRFAKILDQVQIERLKQILWQAEGARAYRDPKLAKTIGLSKEQQAKLSAIWGKYEERLDRLFYSDAAQVGSPDAEKTAAEVRQLFIERESMMAAVVTREQQQRFERLKGKPFDLKRVEPPDRPGSVR